MAATTATYRWNPTINIASAGAEESLDSLEATEASGGDESQEEATDAAGRQAIVARIRRLCECYNFILLALVLRHRDEPQVCHNGTASHPMLSTENLLEFEDEFLSLIREYYEDKENWMPFEALSTLVPNE